MTPKMLPIIEWGWNEDPTCVKTLPKGVVRLNCAVANARIVSESPIYLPGTTIKIVLRGAPAVDPMVDKGIWAMFCDEHGKETRQELDLLELSRFGKPLNHSGWINYHEISGEEFELYGFDAGAFDQYEIEAYFQLNDNGTTMAAAVFSGGKFLHSKAFTKAVPPYANLKIGVFCIPHDGPRFAFSRVADRGPLFIDVKEIEVTGGKE